VSVIIFGSEFEIRSAVECEEFLPRELELDGHHRSRRPAVHVMPGFAVVADPAELGILEHGDVKRRRRVGLRVEPQERRDFFAPRSAWLFLSNAALKADESFESAENHALAVERHGLWIHHRREPFVFHDLCRGAVATARDL
jgi:hypothetical protein